MRILGAASTGPDPLLPVQGPSLLPRPRLLLAALHPPAVLSLEASVYDGYPANQDRETEVRVSPGF